MSSNSRNDFQSLLRDFRLATSSASSHIGSAKTSSPSIHDSIAQLWRVSRLRRETLHQNLHLGNHVPPEELSTNSLLMDSCTNQTAVIETNTIQFHLAICVCIIDSLVHEPIWKEFVGGDCNSSQGGQTHPLTLSTSAEIYIHAKYPERIRSSWVKEKTIATTYRPEWNDIQIVRAMLALASEALKDERTTHLIFVTESCIPIATLYHVARVVLFNSKGPSTTQLQPNRSFIHAYNRHGPQCSRFDEMNCFNILSKYFPQEAVYKALPGWCLLSRTHMQSILDLPTSLEISETSTQTLWSLFETVWAPEELYFPTCLSLLGHLPSDNVVSQSLMFACWDEKARNHSDRAHPRVYDCYFGENLIGELQESGYLFMRKLQKPIDLKLWKSAIECRRSKVESSATVDSSRKRMRPS